MMHLNAVTCHAICLILVQIILTSATNVEFPGPHNISGNYTSQGNSGRSKRSLFGRMPKTLRIRVRYVTGEEIDLTWTKKEKYIVNQNLPVITSSSYPIPTAMNDVGESVEYQDMGKCSAVVYFGKFRTLFGVIGMNYYVADLPYLFDETGKYPGVVGEPYVKKRDYSPVHNLPQIPDMFLPSLMDPVSHNSHQFPEPSFDSNPGPSSKRQRTERDILQKSDRILNGENSTNPSHIRLSRSIVKQYYLESLVLVTRDVADIFKTFWGDYYIEWLVRYYIIYFNAVDMIYNKLKTPMGILLINIAKIVIEDKATAFDVTGNNKLLDNIPQYLYFHHNEYPRDSFDHVFIFTSKQIIVNSVPVHGSTVFDADLYEARKRGEFYNVVPKTLVGFEEHYISAVHEIAKTLKIKIDPWDVDLGGMGQCSSIMQEGSSKCGVCLRWRRTSNENFENFLRNDRHRCFLMNLPRSLHPPGPTGSFRPHAQCRCFGYDSYLTGRGGRSNHHVLESKCSEPLQCLKDVEGTIQSEYTVQPFDGTRCTSYSNRVCWNGECKERTPRIH